MSIIDLSGSWSFTYSFADTSVPITSVADAEQFGLPVYPCTVPGNFELDLIAQGLYEGDPFYGMNIVDLRRYETCHVWYFRSFPTPERNDSSIELAFQGIDCLAEIFLNGTRIGATDNMFIEHTFDVTHHLNQPEKAANEVVVHLRPVTVEAATYPYPPTVWTSPHTMEAMYIRKAPHSYGWDIMPHALSAGLWRPVSLNFKAAEGIETLYLANVSVKPDLSAADLLLSYTLRLPEAPPNTYELRLEARCGDSRFQATHPVLFRERPCGRHGPAAAALVAARARRAEPLRLWTFRCSNTASPLITKHSSTASAASSWKKAPGQTKKAAGQFQFLVNHEPVYHPRDQLGAGGCLPFARRRAHPRDFVPRGRSRLQHDSLLGRKCLRGRPLL